MDGFRTLYCDPGEDFGWALATDFTLLARGIHKMWEFADIIWDALLGGSAELTVLNDPNSAFVYDGQEENPAWEQPIQRIVCEDFRVYPWKIQALKFDPVRTARVIGAITWFARHHNIDLVFQGANIKKAAVLAGAEEFYDFPLHENRHSNDAIQHFVYYTNAVMLGRPLPLSNEKEAFE